MSVRAYRVNEVKLKEAPTFNCWYNLKLLLFLESYDDEENCIGTSDQRNDDGCGIISIPIAALREAIKNKEQLELEDYQIQSFEEDIEYAEKEGWELVDYMCF